MSMDEVYKTMLPAYHLKFKTMFMLNDVNPCMIQKMRYNQNLKDVDKEKRDQNRK